MQQLESGEIEANGKLGGFKKIETNPYDTYVTRKGEQTKFSTLKSSTAYYIHTIIKIKFFILNA